jgi:hypothetical protein
MFVQKKMNLIVESYHVQKDRWPKEGRHILAQFDENSIIVYQAYRPSIGRFAAEYQHFAGEFSLNRMSWIKPNFLWMMYRCGWGTKRDQQIVLAIRLQRRAFDEILCHAVHSSFVPAIYGHEEKWNQALASSDVRLQWDPDHGPLGQPLARRAIQLGMRGRTLAKYAREWLVEVQDISDFVREQGLRVSEGETSRLMTPKEEIYPISDLEIATKLGVS